MWQYLKSWLKSLPIPLTKNQRYDAQTRKVIRLVCRPDSTCIDVGCHKGEVLDIMMAAAPEGRHFGFEPIPELHSRLVARFAGTSCEILPVALTDHKGTSTFNYVVSNPSYSGLRRRDYDRPHEVDTTITVRTDRLDDALPEGARVDLIKIDVEGGELGVLTGARRILEVHHPVVIFEHGMGAAEHYGATPEDVFDLLAGCGLEVNLMGRWLHDRPPLGRDEFISEFRSRRNYYFMAYPGTLRPRR